MNRRPLGVTLVGWAFIVAGVAGTVHHAPELAGPPPFQPAAVWVVALRLLAIVGGAFLLRGANWARWVLLAWLAYHVALGALHSTSEALTHAALLLGIGWVLLRPPAARFFRGEAGATAAGG